MATPKKLFLSVTTGLLALSLIFLSGLTLMPVQADVDELSLVQQAIRAKGGKWRAEENEISRLPKEERKKRLGLLETAPAEEELGATAPEIIDQTYVGTLPATLDWRNVNGMNYVSPVKNQGSCGSCWAFAAAACLESQILIGKNTPGVKVDVAEQALVSCSGAGSCAGGVTGGASNYIRDVGLPVEICFPYTATDASCSNACLTCKTETSTIFAWRYSTSGSTNVEAVKAALATYGPLIAGMTVYSDFYYYKSGVYEYTSGTAQGGHAILIVGYDDANQCFIVKNSWGTGWGEQGFFRISYSQMSTGAYFGRTTIAYEGWRGDPDNPYEPTVTCDYSLSATAQTFAATGGTGLVNVTATGSGCGWTAKSNADWIALTSGASGMGNGAVAFQVAANPGKFTRTGTLTIAGLTFTVTQKGAKNVPNAKK